MAPTCTSATAPTPARRAASTSPRPRRRKCERVSPPGRPFSNISVNSPSSPGIASLRPQERLARNDVAAPRCGPPSFHSWPLGRNGCHRRFRAHPSRNPRTALRRASPCTACPRETHSRPIPARNWNVASVTIVPHVGANVTAAPLSRRRTLTAPTRRRGVTGAGLWPARARRHPGRCAPTTHIAEDRRRIPTPVGTGSTGIASSTRTGDD